MSKTETGVPVRIGPSAARRGTAEDLKERLVLLLAGGLAEGVSYYETPDDRFAVLIGELAIADDDWTCRLIDWMAPQERFRSAAVVAAAELVRVRLRAGLSTSGGNRQVISRAFRRADQPGELLNYWFRRYGRAVPKPIKRAVADGARALYDERALATYDTVGSAVRFADVLNIAHPSSTSRAQAELFQYAVARRRGREIQNPGLLPMLAARAELYRLPQEKRQARLRGADASSRFAHAGMAWDEVVRWAVEPLDARAWAMLLPDMGVRDLLRALPALDAADLDEPTAVAVARRLADPDRVAREEVLPLEILAADRAAASRRWAPELARAMDASLGGVPVPAGRTLILIDRSASMFTQVERGSAVTIADQATTFGAALALRAESADLVQFGTSHAPVAFEAGDSVIEVTCRFGEMGDGNAAAAVRACFDGHDRVVIVTDEPHGSAWRDEHPVDPIPAHVPAYIWNVASTPQGEPPAGDGHRYVFAGLRDAAFAVIPLSEAARRAVWPF